MGSPGCTLQEAGQLPSSVSKSRPNHVPSSPLGTRGYHANIIQNEGTHVLSYPPSPTRYKNQVPPSTPDQVETSEFIRMMKGFQKQKDLFSERKKAVL